jgi:hypothetical protein
MNSSSPSQASSESRLPNVAQIVATSVRHFGRIFRSDFRTRLRCSLNSWKMETYYSSADSKAFNDLE